ncbi:DUF5995 family protein, partial [Streptomyces sp. NPDC057499]|uniref:DUF5995 family protein n=1 Tax=Streptomyces sp. NPDC057499 TaxID=3346150 RepID=UPI00368B9326
LAVSAPFRPAPVLLHPTQETATMATTAQLPTTIDGVIARMEQIDAELDPRDGVACFNHMYLKVTKLVKDNITSGTFGDNAFIERMDVIFAGLYLRNVDADQAGRPVDPAWAPLFAARDNRIIWPLQFALAGMNAHINHDLPVAVVETCAERHTTPNTPPVHQDYEKVNDLLAAAEAEVRAEYEPEILKLTTRDAEALKHAISAFSVAEAREAAWTTAQTFWIEKNGLDPLAYRSHEAALARAVAVVSQGILLPVVPMPEN